jgi:hypothetical protein
MRGVRHDCLPVRGSAAAPGRAPAMEGEHGGAVRLIAGWTLRAGRHDDATPGGGGAGGAPSPALWARFERALLRHLSRGAALGRSAQGRAQSGGRGPDTGLRPVRGASRQVRLLEPRRWAIMEV